MRSGKPASAPVEHFVAIEIRNRHFGRWNQPEIILAVGHAKQIRRELWQISRAIQRLGIHQKRRKNLSVSVLSCADKAAIHCYSRFSF